MKSMLRDLLVLLALLVPWPALARDCPDMSAYFPGNDPDWNQLLVLLNEEFDQCLESSEYFALLGAAELNSGNLSRAIESLERALLLNPENGAALIDYAQALQEDGQLFAALEINTILQERNDVPENLRFQLAERQDLWQKLTRRTRWQADIGGGYDNNLNGGPRSDRIALTLSGEPIFLALSEEYRAASGGFANLGILAEQIRLAPDLQHTLSGRVRSRFSENDFSDVVEITGRYGRSRAGLGRGSAQGVGFSHLSFGGKALFTGTDLRGRLELGGGMSACSQYVAGALQHQVWHTQRLLDGIEVKLGAGARCIPGSLDNHSFSVEVNVINNLAIDEVRLGGDRLGWQLLGEWKWIGLGGVFATRIELASLLDDSGYTELLKSNSRRRIDRGTVSVQYVRPYEIMGQNVDLYGNFYFQEQQSNLGLFDVDDAAGAIGLRFNF